MSSGRPILITGAHRSGTTWVGKMLALAPGVGYVHEPFSPKTPNGLSPAGFRRYYTVVTTENEGRFRPGLEESLALRYDLGAQLRSARSWRDVARIPRDYRRLREWRRNGRRPLMKDPIALLSAEWLGDAFDMDVVVLIRHPAAFAASLKRLGWNHSFATFFDEHGSLPAVVRPYEAEIREQAHQPGDSLAQAAVLWRLLYGAVDGYRERRPDWTFLRHEDASLEPVATFEQLYDRLGLELTPVARAKIEQSSASDNPSEPVTPHAVALDSAASLGRWREQLTSDEVDRLRERTRDVWPSFYAESDW
jgi:hypothetical protein